MGTMEAVEAVGEEVKKASLMGVSFCVVYHLHFLQILNLLKP